LFRNKELKSVVWPRYHPLSFKQYFMLRSYGRCGRSSQLSFKKKHEKCFARIYLWDRCANNIYHSIVTSPIFEKIKIKNIVSPGVSRSAVNLVST